MPEPLTDEELDSLVRFYSSRDLGVTRLVADLRELREAAQIAAGRIVALAGMAEFLKVANEQNRTELDKLREAVGVGGTGPARRGRERVMRCSYCGGPIGKGGRCIVCGRRPRPE